jgi:hypothetical protein
MPRLFTVARRPRLRIPPQFLGNVADDILDALDWSDLLPFAIETFWVAALVDGGAQLLSPSFGLPPATTAECFQF